MIEGLRRRGFVVVLVAAGMTLAACQSGGDQDAQHAAGTAPPSAGRQEPEENKPIPRPYWVDNQVSWPDTLQWIVDTSYEVKIDDLSLRIRGAVSQDITGTRFQNERPLLCEVITAMSVVPEWSFAKGFKVDSVLLRDPVRKQPLRTIYMLSFQRGVDNGTIRTQFLTNMASDYRQSPDLKPGQRLDMTVYMTWNHRYLVATMPPVFLETMDVPAESGPEDKSQDIYPQPSGKQGP